MSEPGSDEQLSPDDVSQEIERALSSIWQRRTGARPTSVTAEMSGNSVRCAIAPGDEDAEHEPSDEAGTDSNAYRQEATTAVRRIMRRKVVAYIAKRNTKANLDTQTFILERAQVKY
ncbi:MAG: hypothetical protein ACJ75R_05705 [Solirubrobacterales bacterium]